MTETFSNSFQFLTLAVQPARRDSLVDCWPADEMQWREVLALAEQHGVRPLLHRALKETDAPRDVLAALKDFAVANARQNLAMTGELLRVLSAFNARSVFALAFKGPALAALAFGEVGAREFSDLDLLIEKADFVRAGQILLELGYSPETDLDAGAAILDAYRVVAFTHQQSQRIVELHWELGPRFFPFKADFAELRQRALCVETAGKQVATFSLEDLIVYLCHHGAKHVWESLAWIADIAWLVDRNEMLNWDLLLRRAGELKCERMLWLGLLLARDLLRAEIPSEVDQLIRSDSTALALSKQVERWLASDSAPSLRERSMFFIRLNSRLSQRVRCAYHLLATPNIADWEFLPLPRALVFLYPLVRLARTLKNRNALSR